MNGVLRDAFIRVHTEDVIGRLAAEFGARYKDSIYLARIRSGTRLFKKIDEWRKANRSVHDSEPDGRLQNVKAARRSKVRELLLERRRMRLLASSNPDEVIEGKKMVTPGSIFEELGEEADLESEDLAELGLGEIVAKGASHDGALEGEDFELVEMSSVDGLDNPHTGVTAADTEPLEGIEDEDSGDKLPEWPAKPRTSAFADKINAKSPSKKSAKTWQWAWLPLTFPAVPKKVCTTSCSKYFTH
jgi:DNA-directed RNA polymerase